MVGFSWSGGIGQTGYQLVRMTSAGSVVLATLPSIATLTRDILPPTVTAACYQLQILGQNNAVIGRSDVLCLTVSGGNGAAPVRSLGITTAESPAVVIGWQPPSVSTSANLPIGYLVVSLGRSPLAILPANVTQAVDVPGRPSCYIVLTLGRGSSTSPLQISGMTNIVCALVGTATSAVAT